MKLTTQCLMMFSKKIMKPTVMLPDKPLEIQYLFHNHQLNITEKTL